MSPKAAGLRSITSADFHGKLTAAATDYLAENGGKPKRGSISLLITGDEESVAVNGTVKLLQWAAERGETFDHCILGEPSNVETLGDTIKAGRRGSLNGTLIVTGRQGHVAYPDRADREPLRPHRHGKTQSGICRPYRRGAAGR